METPGESPQGHDYNNGVAAQLSRDTLTQLTKAQLIDILTQQNPSAAETTEDTDVCFGKNARAHWTMEDLDQAPPATTAYLRWEAQANRWLRDHAAFSSVFKLHHLRATLKRGAGDELQRLEDGLASDMQNLATPEGLMAELKQNFVPEDDHSKTTKWLRAWYCDTDDVLTSARNFLDGVRRVGARLDQPTGWEVIFLDNLPFPLQREVRWRSTAHTLACYFSQVQKAVNEVSWRKYRTNLPKTSQNVPLEGLNQWSGGMAQGSFKGEGTFQGDATQKARLTSKFPTKPNADSSVAFGSQREPFCQYHQRQGHHTRECQKLDEDLRRANASGRQLTASQLIRKAKASSNFRSPTGTEK